MKHLFLSALHSVWCSQKNLLKILDSHVELEDIWTRMDAGFFRDIGMRSDRVDILLEKRRNFDPFLLEKKLEKLNVKLISIEDGSYPELLREIPNSPALIYVRGKLDIRRPLLSVVGSRKYDLYSKQMLARMLPEIISSGMGIVSGGAYGIDSIAHTVVLDNAGYTVSVIGTGIDVNYPSMHAKLYDRIVDVWGAVVSIFPLGEKPNAYNFPIRNEIVAGISRGVLIAQAGIKSGTLITAQLAVEMNRDVFVIPSDLTRENTQGSNALIRDGLGKLILSSEDILVEYGVDLLAQKHIDMRSFKDPMHEKIYNFLLKNPANADEICDAFEVPISQMAVILSVMEIMGYIRNEGGRYCIMG